MNQQSSSHSLMLSRCPGSRMHASVSCICWRVATLRDARFKAALRLAHAVAGVIVSGRPSPLNQLAKYACACVYMGIAPIHVPPKRSSLSVTRRKQHQPGITPNDNTTPECAMCKLVLCQGYMPPVCLSIKTSSTFNAHQVHALKKLTGASPIAGAHGRAYVANVTKYRRFSRHCDFIAVTS